MRKRKKTRRRTATTTGSKFAGALFLLFAAVASGGERPNSQGGYAMLAGTVFRDPGFALPKAEVTVTMTAAADGVKRIKPQKGLTDGRGEFVFRVPPGPAEYKISIKAEGFESIEQTVRIEALERVDRYFTLKPVSKQGVGR
ncbi:MAG: carboxypeptidase regulatory-like domain-containing protein [Bryobacterales bacterium]|nr:carboxypeptidase regulatory-like domain-containing protein [Bryobacterales bacterium]